MNTNEEDTLRTMKTSYLIWKVVWFLTLNWLQLSTQISVEFLRKDTFYVALGRNLELEAKFNVGAGESIVRKTWDCKTSTREVRLVTDDSLNNNRVSVEKGGQLLRIRDVTDGDYGTYIVTITNNNGIQKSDSLQVKKTQHTPKVSISLVCSVSTEGAQWDTPVFTWLVNGVPVTNETGFFSENGKILHLSENFNQNYTCMVTSSQGTSKKVITGPGIPKPQETSCSSHVGALVVISLLALLFAFAAVYFWKKSKPTSTI